MAHKPTDWLGPLIKHEIQAALGWYKKTSGYAKVKHDPESRFDDDGSNLRSEVESSSLPTGSTAQIVKILSTDDPLLLISDGVTLIRTRFSPDAFASLESDIGEPIDLNTKGDVFSIRKCTVVITPYGPTEGHVQLQVDEVQYHYHLRKIVGATTPAGQRPEITHLIGEVMRVRHPEPEAEPPMQKAQPQQNRLPQRSSHSDPFETQAVHLDPQSPASQASIVIASSPPVPVSQAPKTPPQVSTQISTKRKRNTPTFLKDGVEMPMGVNLDRPTAANPSRPAPKHVGVEQNKRANVSDSSAGLLSLLGKQIINPEAQTDAPVAPAKSAYRNVLPASLEQRQPVREDASQQNPSSKAVQEAITAPETSQKARTAQKPSRPARRPYWQKPIPAAQQRLLDSPTSWLPALPGRQFPHPNVPMELLSKWNEQAEARPESVVLSQSAPSRSQEVPLTGGAEDSRPLETTTESSEEDQSESDEEQLAWSSSPPRPAAAQCNTQSANQQSHPLGSKHSAMDSSPFGSRSSQQFLSSPACTPSRPSTADKRSDLPPDSSFENAVAPRALPGREPDREYNSMPTRPVRRPSSPPQSSRARPSASSQPFPPGGDAHVPLRSVPRRSSSPPLSRGRPSASSQHLARGGDSYRPSYPHPASSTRPRSPPRHSLPTRFSPNQNSSRDLFRGSIQYRPPSNAAVSAATSPEQQARPATASSPGTGNAASSGQSTWHVSQSPVQLQRPPKAPSSTAKTVIKATQMSKPSQTDGAKDEMPQSRDPRLEHQQRRSEHFKGLQRRQWIRANYTPNPKKSFSMGALLSAYKKVHPKDRPRLSDLAEAYRDVFPDDGEGGENEGQGIESLEGEQADKNVPDTTTRARASLADEEGAEATPSKILDRDQVPLNKESALARRPVDQTAVEGRAPRTATARITHRQDAEALVPLVFKRTNVTASAGQRSDKKTELAIAGPSPAAGKMAPSATLPAKAPARPALTAPLTGSTVATSAPDHRAWLMKQMERQQRRFRIEGASRRVGGAETSIKAFADAWRGVRSRGAFARKERKLGETERREGRLRVLAWEL